jgi:hypothetical protein
VGNGDANSAHNRMTDQEKARPIFAGSKGIAYLIAGAFIAMAPLSIAFYLLLKKPEPGDIFAVERMLAAMILTGLVVLGIVAMMLNRQGRPVKLALPVAALVLALYVAASWYWPSSWATGFQSMIEHELMK